MFGERLTNVLQDKEISQITLSQELGVTQQAVNRWCKNKTEPDNNMIVKIAQYLNISTDFLLGNDKKNSKYEIELKEKMILKKFLIANGYMKENEDLSDKELKKLIKFLKQNKDFIKNCK